MSVFFFVCLLVLFFTPDFLSAWQQTIRIPIRLRRPSQHASPPRNLLERAIQQLITSNYTEFTTNSPYIASIPALQATLCFAPDEKDYKHVDLLIDCPQAADVEGVCRLLFANHNRQEADVKNLDSQRRHNSQVLDLQPIRSLLASFLSQRPPDPGIAVPLLEDILKGNKGNTVSQQQHLSKILSWLQNPQTLQVLHSEGWVILDDALVNIPPPASSSTLSLSQSLQDTGQGSSIRTDKVGFLRRHEAKQPIDIVYDGLILCASILNEQQERYRLPNTTLNDNLPLSPATLQRPLTIPTELQWAEYRFGDFYKAHSDNSLVYNNQTEAWTRSNFREYTCILYSHFRTNWKMEQDGGALRLYVKTQELKNVNEVLLPQDHHDPFEYIDIAPVANRLLVFDSKLVHSVQPVTSSTKIRQALTLWINRPTDDDSIQGEVYF